MKVLIQFHCIPEQVMTAVVDLTSEQFDILKHANGVYCGLDTDYTEEQYHANRAINEALCEHDSVCRKYAEEDGYGDWFGIFSEHKVEADNHREPLSLESVDCMINTGYIM